jgi:hypothetical protein
MTFYNEDKKITISTAEFQYPRLLSRLSPVTSEWYTATISITKLQRENYDKKTKYDILS